MKAHSVILSALAAMWFLSSCSSSKQMGQRSYEDDEVYYQRGETFITEVPEPAVATSNAEVPEDEYYTPGQGGGVTNNYYGDTYINDGWNNSFNTWHNRSRWVMVWDPIFGWHLTYNFGWNNCAWANDPWGPGGWHSGLNNWGWNNGWNSWGGYQNWNGWNSGFWGDPFCSNTPLFYTPGYFWNGQGYGFNGMGGAWAWGDDGMNNQVTFGHRSPIAANSYFSSSYDHNTIYHDRVKKPILQQGEGGVPSDMVDRKPNSDEQPFVSRFPYVEPPRPSGGTGDRDARRPVGNDDYFTPKPAGSGDTERRPDRVEPPRPSNPPAERRPSSPPSGGGDRDRGGRDGDRNSGSGFSNPSQGSGRTSPPPSSPSRSSGGSSRRR
jgi:hypothetical protein